MRPDLQHVGTRQLLSEVASRVPHLLRRRLRRRAPDARRPPEDEVFGTCELGGRTVPLRSRYRTSVKGWTRYFWQTDVLMRLRARTHLPSGLAGLADELRHARTPSRPLAAIAEDLDAFCPRHPELAREIVTAQGRRWEVVPTGAEVRQLADAYRGLVDRVLRRCEIPPRERGGLMALEIGCGTGYGTMAMASRGLRAVGIDVDLSACATGSERTLVQHELLRTPERAARVRFDVADSHRLPFPHRTVDLVHNTSVLEHVADPAAALREIARVLKPGGRLWIEVDPWFSPAGGHMLCTLDFPWGHARLAPEAFEAYVREHRPHEADASIAMYGSEFQTPRRSMAEIGDAVLAAGLRLVDWQESRVRFENHYRLLDEGVIDDVRAVHPTATVRDLMTDSYSFIAVTT